MHKLISAPGAFLICGLIGCSTVDLSDNDASSSKGSDGEESGEEEVFTPDLSIFCEDEDPTWCTTLSFDASAFTSPTGEVVKWYWELDGESYEGPEVSHTFEVNDEKEQQEFEGKISVTDSKGVSHTATMRVVAHLVEESSTGDTNLFWFSGVHGPPNEGGDCVQFIHGIGGCVQGDFDMGWREDVTNNYTGLYQQYSGNYTVISPQHIDHILLGPNEMKWRLLLPSQRGTIEIVKSPSGQLIEQDSECNFSGGQ